MKHLNPMNDRVIIKPIEEVEQTYGNIVIPDMGKERPELGEVVAVGPGRRTEFGHFIPVNARVGDTVMIPKIGTIRVDFENEEYYIIPDKEILCTVETKKEQ